MTSGIVSAFRGDALFVMFYFYFLTPCSVCNFLKFYYLGSNNTTPCRAKKDDEVIQADFATMSLQGRVGSNTQSTKNTVAVACACACLRCGWCVSDRCLIAVGKIFSFRRRRNQQAIVSNTRRRCREQLSTMVETTTIGNHYRI
jgi:hypothetical protein